MAIEVPTESDPDIDLLRVIRDDESTDPVHGPRAPRAGYKFHPATDRSTGAK
jgi:hypothetical protein